MSYLDRINKILNPLPIVKEEVVLSPKDELLIKYQKRIDSLIRNEKQPSAIDYQHQKIIDEYTKKIDKVTEVKREEVMIEDSKVEDIPIKVEEVKREEVKEEVKREEIPIKVESYESNENIKHIEPTIIHEEPIVKKIIHHSGHLFPTII